MNIYDKIENAEFKNCKKEDTQINSGKAKCIKYNYCGKRYMPNIVKK